MPAKYVDVYQELTDAGCETDHHESDLYVRPSPMAYTILAQSGYRWTGFTGTDGQPWLEVAFAYTPFWKRRQAAAGADSR